MSEELKDNDVAAVVEIRTLRDKYDPTHKVYCLVDKPMPTGEFDVESWDYGYRLEERGMDVYSIDEAKALPQILERLDRAMRAVTPEDVLQHRYAIELRSELPKDELEREIDGWLTDEGFAKVICDAVKLPRVKSVKKIKIPMKAFAEMLERAKRKEGKGK